MFTMGARFLYLFIFVIWKVACCGYAVNSTSAAIECRVFQHNGKEIYGFSRKSPPLLQLPCYEQNGHFNCQGFYGIDKEHCEKNCCAKTKNDIADRGLKIECKEFTVKDRKVRGFSRKTPPIINLPCFESDGIGTFNCLSLWEPERSFCNTTCCNGSLNIEVKNEWEVNEKIDCGDGRKSI